MGMGLNTYTWTEGGRIMTGEDTITRTDLEGGGGVRDGGTMVPKELGETREEKKSRRVR